MKKFFTLLVVCFAALAASAQSYDLTVVGFLDNATDQNEVTTLDLGPRNGLAPVVICTNNGPDAVPTTEKINIILYINGSPINEAGTVYVQFNKEFPAGQSGYITSGSGALISASDMDQMGLTTFDFGYEMSGEHDVNPANNMGTLHVVRRVGINDVEANGVNVYPNPASEVINIANVEGAQISVFDITGKLITSVASASANETISCADFAKGLYIVRIAEGNNVITKKVSVVR